MTKSVDPDQTGKQSDLDLHCFVRPICFYIDF